MGGWAHERARARALSTLAVHLLAQDRRRHTVCNASPSRNTRCVPLTDGTFLARMRKLGSSALAVLRAGSPEGDGDDPRWLLSAYNAAVAGTLDHLTHQSSPGNLTFVAEQARSASEVGAADKEPLLVPKMDHLVCFLPATLALGLAHGAGHETLAIAREAAIRTAAASHALLEWRDGTGATFLPPASSRGSGVNSSSSSSDGRGATGSSWPWSLGVEVDAEFRDVPHSDSMNAAADAALAAVGAGGGDARSVQQIALRLPHALEAAFFDRASSGAGSNGTAPTTPPPAPMPLQGSLASLEEAHALVQSAARLVTRWTGGGEAVLLRDLAAAGAVAEASVAACGDAAIECAPSAAPGAASASSTPSEAKQPSAVSPTAVAAEAAATSPHLPGDAPPTPAPAAAEHSSKSSAVVPAGGGAGGSAPPLSLLATLLALKTKIGSFASGLAVDTAAAAAAAAAAIASASSGRAVRAASASGGAATPPDPFLEPFAATFNPSSARSALLHASRSLTRTCVAMYDTTSTGLAPEIVTFAPGRDFAPNADARHSLLRPETLESLFVLHALGLGGEEGASGGDSSGACGAVPAGSDWLQEAGWRIMGALERHARVRSGGHAAVVDVGVGPFGPLASAPASAPGAEAHDGGCDDGACDAPAPSEPVPEMPSAGRSNQRDRLDSFVLAETWKYAYLLLSPRPAVPAAAHNGTAADGDGSSSSSGSGGSDDTLWADLLALRGWVFSTEGHPLRPAGMTPSQWKAALAS